MKRSLPLKISLAVLLLTCAVPAALAQSGPTGPSGSPYPSPAPAVGGVVQQNVMTADRLAALLRADGHQVDVKTFPNGGRAVIATVTRDGWRYIVEFEFNPAGNNLNVLCPLGNAASQFSSAQLLELLKKSYDLCPMHFTYRKSDQRLCLEDSAYSPINMTEAGVRSILDRVLKAVKDTHPLWDTSRWPVGGQAPVANLPAPPIQTAPPAAPQNPLPVQAPSQGLANSTWIGTETLGGYGRLEFRFLANGQAVMIDSDGSHTGTYTQVGNTVTLRFYGNTVTYTGTINGRTLAGTAQNGNGSWNFSVSR